jgi:hypothetical protein
MPVGQHCRLGSRFSRCNDPVAETCQYCGKPFCARHTYYREGHEAVCTSNRCRAKRDDFVAYQAYRRAVIARNQSGLCGVESCTPHPDHECSLCHGHFCALHVRERMYPYREGWVTIQRAASVCARCWERRKIWRGA